MAFLAVLSEMSWCLHPWGLVFSAPIGEALKGARESPRAHCEGFAFFPSACMRGPLGRVRTDPSRAPTTRPLPPTGHDAVIKWVEPGCLIVYDNFTHCALL
jgi:hypothetical protein